MGTVIKEGGDPNDDEEGNRKPYLEHRGEGETNKGDEDADQHKQGDGQVVQGAVDNDGGRPLIDGDMVLEHQNPGRIPPSPSERGDGIDGLSRGLYFKNIP